MTMFRVQVTNTQDIHLRRRIAAEGLDVEYLTEGPSGPLVLIIEDLSQAHSVREILIAEGLTSLYE